MQAITQWHIKAKIGYKSVSDGGSAWLNWQQQDYSYRLLLSGPFGAGSVQIFGNKDTATLRQADAADISAHSASALSSKLFGWDLPIDELPYWVRGIPAPGSQVKAQKFNGEGLLAAFHQTGWDLKLSRYQDTEAGKLPGKLIATQRELRFTLLIKEHDFSTSQPPF